MLAALLVSPPVAELTCRHPLANATCFGIWIQLSVPFIAAGGAWSLLSLSRARRAAPSPTALRVSIAVGFLFAFVSSTVLAVVLDVFHLHSSGGVEIALFLLWVFAWQTAYVRLVFRAWRREV